MPFGRCTTPRKSTARDPISAANTAPPFSFIRLSRKPPQESPKPRWTPVENSAGPSPRRSPPPAHFIAPKNTTSATSRSAAPPRATFNQSIFRDQSKEHAGASWRAAVSPCPKKVNMAERVGFEPTVEFPLHSLSRRALSTAQTPLRGYDCTFVIVADASVAQQRACLTRKLR